MTSDTTPIDVRRIPPRERHPLLFATFDALAVGQAMELVNDHDPLPLHDQFQARQPGGFRWEYLQRGPLNFHVRITRESATASVPAPAKSPCCGGCGCA